MKMTAKPNTKPTTKHMTAKPTTKPTTNHTNHMTVKPTTKPLTKQTKIPVLHNDTSSVVSKLPDSLSVANNKDKDGHDDHDAIGNIFYDKEEDDDLDDDDDDDDKKPRTDIILSSVQDPEPITAAEGDYHGRNYDADRAMAMALAAEDEEAVNRARNAWHTRPNAFKKHWDPSLPNTEEEHGVWDSGYGYGGDYDDPFWGSDNVGNESWREETGSDTQTNEEEFYAHVSGALGASRADNLRFIPAPPLLANDPNSQGPNVDYAAILQETVNRLGSNYYLLATMGFHFPTITATTYGVTVTSSE
jgi:hypothetical protein